MSRKQIAERLASDEDYRRGWYGEGEPSVDYDDGFTSGWRSASRTFSRLVLWFIPFLFFGMAAAFVIAWTSRP